MIRARKSSPRQIPYFGEYGAYRPYILLRVPPEMIVTNELVKQVIDASFEEEMVRGVGYRKQFELGQNDVFEFDFARVYVNPKTRAFEYEKFIKIKVI